MIRGLLVVSSLLFFYIGYETFKKPTIEKKCQVIYYKMCPICERFQEPINQYGHCSEVCSAIYEDGPYDE
jgi:hypothetical protein